MKATYIDSMGTDLSVVNAAKVSFGKRSEWEVLEWDFWDNEEGETSHYKELQLSKQDQGLIQFLARGCTSGDWEILKGDLAQIVSFKDDVDWQKIEELLNHIRKMPRHWSPFAHTAVTLHLKMPIFVARQIMKHTTGIEYNEVSRRYVDSRPEFYVPDVWRKKADDVKQGSSEEGINPEYNPAHLYNKILHTYLEATRDYGVAPEQARMILPQSMYTEVIATGNLYAWANLYIQRTDSHAQKETQDLAEQIGKIIQPLYPVSWKELTK